MHIGLKTAGGLREPLLSDLLNDRPQCVGLGQRRVSEPGQLILRLVPQVRRAEGQRT